MIFKAITGSSGHAFWWERTVLHSMETVVRGAKALIGNAMISLLRNHVATCIVMSEFPKAEVNILLHGPFLHNVLMFLKFDIEVP